MRPEIIMVLGRLVWRRAEGGWYQQAPQDSGASVAAYVHDCIGRSSGRRVALVYEPEGMGHQEVECPKASRAVFSSISRIRAEFPVVVSEDLGWGMEPPVPVAGGSYSTLIHYELGRGLAQLSADSESGPELVAAWSVFTLAESFLAGRGSGDASLLMLLPGFTAFAGGTLGRRSLRVWPQPMSERDWRALVFMAVGQAGSGDSRRSVSVSVVTEGNPEDNCPCWDEIRNSSRVECLVGLDEFAGCAARMPTNHSANLVLGFPAKMNLDPALSIVAVTAAAISVFMGASLRADNVEFQRLESESHAHLSLNQERIDMLERNRSEIELLQRELPETSGSEPSARAAALRGLAAAIPDSLTLTAFTVGADNSFELEATLVGREFDQEALRRSLDQNGFSLASPGTFSFDAASRRISARGTLKLSSR
ncbi:MAG TPA: hypothetical protein VFE25_10605 [Opitutaceae bacterium]|jgi:hypothetical protein|nr:hypothetical protein [Opitutaceae bacterium]